MESTERRSSAKLRSDGSLSAGTVPAVNKAQRTVLEIVGSIIVAMLSLAVYFETGLYSAAEAGVVRIILGLLIASWFVLNFRIALHMK
jgi:hypothetical protein